MRAGEGDPGPVDGDGAAGDRRGTGPSERDRDGDVPGGAGPAGRLPDRGGPGQDGPGLLVATRNPHKLEEIRELLGDLPVRFLSLDEAGIGYREEEERIEVYDTFDANARAKARYFHRRSGFTTVADDSGLCVDALGGGPGVHTKRFAPEEMAERLGRDEANNQWLLERLQGVPTGDRGAHYHCSVAVEGEDVSFVVEGQVHGRIARELRGEGGFGYDPLFVVPDRGRTFGELPPEVKQAISHRARALRELRPRLERWTGEGEGR